MKVSMVFLEWKKNGQFVDSEEYQVLAEGDFHGGSTFDGEINLDEENNAELQRHLVAGYQPFFLLLRK